MGWVISNRCLRNALSRKKKEQEGTVVKLERIMNNEEPETGKRPMIVLSGPTAVGKTKLSIALAKAVNGEIVSADSMQVYRHMDIGSAKITQEEMQGILHHMIDILEPWEEFSVAVFKEMCEQCLPGIYERGHIPIVTGGPGFYVQALLRDIDFSGRTGGDTDGDTRHFGIGTDDAGRDTRHLGIEADDTGRDTGYSGEADDIDRDTGFPGSMRRQAGVCKTGQDIRAVMEKAASDKGAAYLHEQLRQVDPLSAELIHANNIKRTVRALEYFYLTGEPISSHNKRERDKPSAYHSCYFVLNDIREHIYERIGLRVEKMLEQGLVAEVEALRAMGCHRGMVSMQGLGYKEILSCLEGEITLEEAVELIKRDTRHFAKRQLTWFRREQEVVWINKNEFDGDEDRILEFMLAELDRRGIAAPLGRM